jgi:hypothetical protein
MNPEWAYTIFFMKLIYLMLPESSVFFQMPFLSWELTKTLLTPDNKMRRRKKQKEFIAAEKEPHLKKKKKTLVSFGIM